MQSEIDAVCLEIWWVNRDEEFDTLCKQIKSVSKTARREQIVHDFHMHTIDLIYNELSIEP